MEEKANHVADGLADAGRDSLLPDIREYFSHGRRWHIRMGGIRCLDGVRSSARLYLSERSLNSYHKDRSTRLDRRNLNFGALRAFCAGKSKRGVWNRAENTKFVLGQLATKSRKKGWGSGLNDIECRACRHQHAETVGHLLVSCTAKKCAEVRRKFLFELKHLAYNTSADLGDFLFRKLTMISDGRLLYDHDADAAYGLVTGFFPFGFGAEIGSNFIPACEQ